MRKLLSIAAIAAVAASLGACTPREERVAGGAAIGAVAGGLIAADGPIGLRGLRTTRGSVGR